MSLEADMQKYHPLAMQKEAEEMALRLDWDDFANPSDTENGS